MLVLELVTFGLALWLGLYLIGRDPAKPTLRYAGLGLASYAFSLASALLAARDRQPPGRAGRAR